MHTHAELKRIEEMHWFSETRKNKPIIDPEDPPTFPKDPPEYPPGETPDYPKPKLPPDPPIKPKPEGLLLTPFFEVAAQGHQHTAIKHRSKRRT
jgi:hypothetical protein